MGGGEEEVSLGFRPFLGRVYLVIIFVWRWEVSGGQDLVVCGRTHCCGPC